MTYRNCPWLPSVGKLESYLPFLKITQCPVIELTLKNKNPLTYSSLVLCDSNSSFTLYTSTLIFQSFLHMFQTYVYTISLSVNHTPLCLFIIYANLSAQHAVSLCLSPIHPPAPPERESFSPKWNEVEFDTLHRLPTDTFLVYALCCYLSQQNCHFSFLYTDINQTPKYLVDYLQKEDSKSVRFKHAVPIVFANYPFFPKHFQFAGSLNEVIKDSFHNLSRVKQKFDEKCCLKKRKQDYER